MLHPQLLAKKHISPNVKLLLEKFFMHTTTQEGGKVRRCRNEKWMSRRVTLFNPPCIPAERGQEDDEEWKVLNLYKSGKFITRATHSMGHRFGRHLTQFVSVCQPSAAGICISIQKRYLVEVVSLRCTCLELMTFKSSALFSSVYYCTVQWSLVASYWSWIFRLVLWFSLASSSCSSKRLFKMNDKEALLMLPQAAWRRIRRWSISGTTWHNLPH